MEHKASTIQNAELVIMRYLWKRDCPVPLIDIRHELSTKRCWEDSTIKTLLKRLCDKGIAKTEQRGVYYAILSEEEYRQWSNKNYLSKLFDGSAKRLVASLVSDGQLSPDDIAELSAMFKKELNIE